MIDTPPTLRHVEMIEGEDALLKAMADAGLTGGLAEIDGQLQIIFR